MKLYTVQPQGCVCQRLVSPSPSISVRSEGKLAGPK